MSWQRRKTAPKVRDGRVQRKNNWRPTPDNYGQPQVSIARLRPGRGYRHVLRCADVYTFVHLLPDWDSLKTSLNQILLVAGSNTIQGWFRPGKVAVCALPSNLELVFHRDFFARDGAFLDRLRVPYEFFPEEKTQVRCWLTPATARCFLLMRVLVHELGHHHDRITNPKGWCSRGEAFAERYERIVEEQVWSRYLAVFGDPRVRTT
ncbi:MAG TPA: hypothetical protein VEL76_17135 [Gemmataceae bacterium]|nr:hypothetical protein [Gemmataceae bacterium]